MLYVLKQEKKYIIWVIEGRMTSVYTEYGYIPGRITLGGRYVRTLLCG